MAERLRVLGQSMSVDPFHGGNELSVKCATALLKEACVRDVVHEDVAEGVLQVGKELTLDDELCAVEPTERRVQFCLT